MTLAIALAWWLLSSAQPDFPKHTSVMGAASAPVTLVVYTDHVCPACRAFAALTLPEIRARFVDGGALRVVVVDVARTPEARGFANAALCAGEFGKSWAFHDEAATHPSPIGAAVLERIAATVGVPADPFARCTAAGRHRQAVEEQTAFALRSGIDSLPAFAVQTRGWWPRRPLPLTGDIAALETLVAQALGR